MGRKPTGRTTKLVRVPVRFEAQIKALVQRLKEQEAQRQSGTGSSDEASA